MSRKGFTLVELLGVLVILSIVVLVAFPNILSVFQKTDSKINEATEKLLETNARTYVNENNQDGKKINCVNVSTLVEEAYTMTPIANVSQETAKEIETNWSVTLEYNEDGQVKNAKVQKQKCS